MKHVTRTFMLAVVALGMSATVVGAQTGAAPSPKKAAKAAAKQEKAILKAEAKVSMADAKKSALAQVPGGKVKSSELERAAGKLIYTFDIATKGKAGIDEVHVDAMTGAVLSNAHKDVVQKKAGKKKKKG